jgi:6-phosphogluconolactonase
MGAGKRLIMRDDPEIQVFPDPSAMSLHAAGLIAELAGRPVDREGRFTLCLSGGSTPRETYALLAAPQLADEIPWPGVHIFWGDERCIPLERPDNHFTMTSDLLFSKVPIPAENIHRMRGEADDPEEAARDYELELIRFFGLKRGEIPRFDLVLLGMGEDGHCASLYPGTAGLAERGDLVVAHYVPQREGHRLTLTLRVLNNARQIIFLVTGESKAEALKAVLDGENDEADLPAGRVRPRKGKVRWLVDRAAAGLLQTR